MCHDLPPYVKSPNQFENTSYKQHGLYIYIYINLHFFVVQLPVSVLTRSQKSRSRSAPVRLVESLLRRGADVAARSNDGESALHVVPGGYAELEAGGPWFWVMQWRDLGRWWEISFNLDQFGWIMSTWRFTWKLEKTHWKWQLLKVGFGRAVQQSYGTISFETSSMAWLPRVEGHFPWLPSCTMERSGMFCCWRLRCMAGPLRWPTTQSFWTFWCYFSLQDGLRGEVQSWQLWSHELRSKQHIPGECHKISRKEVRIPFEKKKQEKCMSSQTLQTKWQNLAMRTLSFCHGHTWRVHGLKMFWNILSIFHCNWNDASRFDNKKTFKK